MDDSIRVYEELAFKMISTEKLIRQSPNPMREYEDGFIDGAIIDIGCGQSNFLLEYASFGKKIYAIDDDQMQLDFLRKRVEQISVPLENWVFLNLKFPQDGLPDDFYSVIILSNLLHFFTFDECKNIGNLINKIARKGTFIYTVVHSHTYYMNDPQNPDNNEYFKHYFTVDDLKAIFPIEKYEWVYLAEIEKLSSDTENSIINTWLDTLLEKGGIKNPRTKKKYKSDYLKNRGESQIQFLLRKK
jgi:SAM-dependent methyltransferase